MSITDRLFKTIVQGKEGRNIGIPSGLDTIDEYTYALQRGYLYTIFADSGKMLIIILTIFADTGYFS